MTAARTWAYPAIDPESNQILAFFGRKGSGKSAAAREHFRQWPGCDRLVIDVTGDADPGDDLQATVLHGPLVEDIDKAIGAGLFPRDRKMLLWIDEGGEAFPVNQTGPNGRLLLHQSRHYNASALICAPRPKGLDPLSYGPRASSTPCSARPTGAASSGRRCSTPKSTACTAWPPSP